MNVNSSNFTTTHWDKHHIILIYTYKMFLCMSVCLSPHPCGGAKGPKTWPKASLGDLDPLQTKIMLAYSQHNLGP